MLKIIHAMSIMKKVNISKVQLLRITLFTQFTASCVETGHSTLKSHHSDGKLTIIDVVLSAISC